MDTNPVNESDTSAMFGTYGDDIPLKFREYKPHVCQPGTSAATAIAAGITAVILAYVAILPIVVPLDDKAGVLERIRTTEGIQKVFRRMSQNMGGCKWFLNPLRFFQDSRTDAGRYCAIYDCMQANM